VIAGSTVLRRVAVWLAMALATWSAPPAARAQEPQAPTQESAVESLAGEAAAEEGPAPDEDLALIESLLEEDDSIVEGGLAYDPGDRRDPFRSLLVTVEATRRDGPRPQGIPGLVISELTVTGVWLTAEGPVAQVQSADDPVSYLLREGDRLYDGDVIRISYARNEGAEVEFKQIVDDPTAPKPFREIVKRVEP
jgi:hypothetical protein